MRFADVLREDIWAKGASIDGTKLCLGLQWLRWKHQRIPVSELLLLQKVATDLFPTRGRFLMAINDHPETTFSDVMSIAKEYDRRLELKEAGIK